MAIEERVPRLEGIVEQIDQRLGDMTARIASLESRVNTQIALTVAMWVTTMLAVLSTLAAVLLRT
jgi:hypothetical protein